MDILKRQRVKEKQSYVLDNIIYPDDDFFYENCCIDEPHIKVETIALNIEHGLFYDVYGYGYIEPKYHRDSWIARNTIGYSGVGGEDCYFLLHYGNYALSRIKRKDFSEDDYLTKSPIIYFKPTINRQKILNMLNIQPNSWLKSHFEEMSDVFSIISYPIMFQQCYVIDCPENYPYLAILVNPEIEDKDSVFELLYIDNPTKQLTKYPAKYIDYEDNVEEFDKRTHYDYVILKKANYNSPFFEEEIDYYVYMIKKYYKSDREKYKLYNTNLVYED